MAFKQMSGVHFSLDTHAKPLGVCQMGCTGTSSIEVHIIHVQELMHASIIFSQVVHVPRWLLWHDFWVGLLHHNAAADCQSCTRAFNHK